MKGLAPPLGSGEKKGDMGLVGPGEKDEGAVVSEKQLARDVALWE